MHLEHGSSQMLVIDTQSHLMILLIPAQHLNLANFSSQRESHVPFQCADDAHADQPNKMLTYLITEKVIAAFSFLQSCCWTV